MLTLGDLTNGKTDHSFNIDAARDALLAMPVSSIQGVQSFLDGTSNSDQTNQLFQHLSTYAKTYGVGLGFHNQSKQAEVAVTDGGTVYTQLGDGNVTMTQVYPTRMPSSTVGNVSTEEEKARVDAFRESGSAMIDAADTEVTSTGMETESASAAKKKSGKVYASQEPFHVRHRNPVSGKQSTTTKYSHVVTPLTNTLGGGHLLVAKIN